MKKIFIILLLTLTASVFSIDWSVVPTTTREAIEMLENEKFLDSGEMFVGFTYDQMTTATVQGSKIVFIIMAYSTDSLELYKQIALEIEEYYEFQGHMGAALFFANGEYACTMALEGNNIGIVIGDKL